MDIGFRMHAERTPNPDSVKWVLSQFVVENGTCVSFASPVASDVSPLAARLFAVEGVTAVFLGPDFVTVSKRQELAWADLAEPIVEGIKAWVAAEEPAVGESYEAERLVDDGGIVARIRRILEDEIRPQVAMDGGDVVFAGFSDGVVQVYLRGACAGCPSSSVTLKMGIEARLRQEIPEIHSVVAV